MGVRLAEALDLAAPGGAEGPARWKCALVNNMPDAAFGATEDSSWTFWTPGPGARRST